MTARKKTERLQEAPVAVTAIGSDRLERIGATDISDLSGRAPNVTINTIGNFGSSVAVFIRGIGNGDPDSTVDPSVGIYVDGVYIPRTANSSLDLFDVEQVDDESADNEAGEASSSDDSDPIVQDDQKENAKAKKAAKSKSSDESDVDEDEDGVDEDEASAEVVSLDAFRNKK